MRDDFDIIVIGGGPGGTEVALRAAAAGLKGALVEKGDLGGVCLNAGCIPLKTLLAASAAFAAARLRSFQPPAASTMWAEMQRTKDATVTRLRQALAAKLAAAGVTVVRGTAALLSPTDVVVAATDGTQATLSGKNVFVATGSVPAPLSGWEWSSRILDTAAALRLAHLPASVVIAGGGVAGCELATLFAEMDVATTIVEAAPRLLPGLDIDLGRFAAKTLVAKGVRVLTGTRVETVHETETGVELVAGALPCRAERLVVALGRRPNLEGIAPDCAGLVLTPHGDLVVDALMRTSAPSVLAVGDVVGGPLLAHAATEEARRAVAAMLGEARPPSVAALAQGVFTHPEIATAGLTADDCRGQGISVRVLKASNLANGSAHAIGETTGWVKLVAHRATDRLLGVQIAGAHASAIIGEAALAIGTGVKVRDFQEAIRPHPSLQEIFGLARGI